MSEYQTTTWENVKNRAQYLKNELLHGEGAEWAKAICEEIDLLKIEIKKAKEGKP